MPNPGIAALACRAAILLPNIGRAAAGSRQWSEVPDFVRFSHGRVFSDSRNVLQNLEPRAAGIPRLALPAVVGRHHMRDDVA